MHCNTHDIEECEIVGTAWNQVKFGFVKETHQDGWQRVVEYITSTANTSVTIKVFDVSTHVCEISDYQLKILFHFYY